MIKELKNWEKATQELADKFVRKYYGKDADSGWVSNEIGDVFVVADHYWNVGDMVDALRFNCSEERLFEWYDLSVDAGMEGRHFQNLRTFAEYGLISTREIISQKLKDNKPVDLEEASKSLSLEKKILKDIDVYKRLKDK